jgi:hypothetical protein
MSTVGSMRRGRRTSSGTSPTRASACSSRAIVPRCFRVEPILKSFPWAVAAPIGLVLLFVDRHPLRWTALLATVVALGSTVTYLAWVFGGTDQLEIWIIRYHIAWFPLWAILAGVVFERLLATTGGFGSRRDSGDQSVARQE